MKNYTITVNGNVYEVTVEEGTAADPQQLQHQRQLLQAAPKAAPTPAAAPAGAAGCCKDQRSNAR